MNKKDLANAILASGVSDSATSATLVSGYGATMPAVPFKLTVTPFGQLSTMGNSEIWLVTARSGETLTITRAQNGTTAKTFAAGDIVSNGVYAEDVIGGNNVITGETPSGTINGTNKVFTLSQSYVANSTAVFVNGLMQRRGTDYVETTPGSGVVTLDEAPLTGSNVRISYQNAASSSGNADTVDGKHASELAPIGEIVMTLRTTPDTNFLFMDGGTYNKADYPALWALQASHPAYFTSSDTLTFTLKNMKGRFPVAHNEQAGSFFTELGGVGGSLTHNHGFNRNNSGVPFALAAGSTDVDRYSSANLPNVTSSNRQTGMSWAGGGNTISTYLEVVGTTETALNLPPWFIVNFQVRAA